jgi:exosortase A-associated hydrolase 2
MGPAFQETSGYFPSPSGDLYGTLYLPDDLGCDTGVVLVEPFGEEKKCAYRMLVRLARVLAGHGVATLRFDLPGTGDSPGEHGEMDAVAWAGGVRAAAEEVLALPGIQGWVPIGARFGALPALQVAVGLSPRAVVLLEPVLNGTECLRDLERRQKIKDMMSGQRNDSGPDAAARWSTGETVDFGGFPVSAKLAEQLAAVDLCSLLADLTPACGLQIVRVSGSKKLPPAWQPLAEAAENRALGEVTVVQDKPFWGQLEYYESDAVIDVVVPFLARALHVPAAQTGESVA